MKKLLTSLLLAGSLLMASPNQPTAPKGDEDITKAITHEIRMYPQYGIWDDVNFQVANGQVILSGEVNQPYKKSDIGNIVKRVPGVVSVTNDLKVAPLSNFDDRLRIQVARAIYGYPRFTRYGMQAQPPIHILVDNGRVTLTGVVATESDKQLAGLRAASAGMSFGSITNNLQVERPTAKS
jgi:hyperosmotically inducible periplasmic protein